MTRRVMIVLSLVVLAACGSSPSATPEFGGGKSASPVDSSELRRLKADAAIEDCPDVIPDPDRPAGASHDPAASLPEAELACLGGGRDLALAQAPRPAVINLWASYCKPCRQELPLLQAASEKYDDVTFIGVDMADPNPAAALRLAGESGVTYPQLADPDGMVRAPLKVMGLPQTVMIDTDGSVVYTHRGAFDSVDQIGAAITQNLGVRRE